MARVINLAERSLKTEEVYYIVPKKCTELRNKEPLFILEKREGSKLKMGRAIPCLNSSLNLT